MHGYALTAEQMRRVRSALAETQRYINREQSYSADLQNHARLIFYRSHKSRLQAMIDAGRWIESPSIKQEEVKL